MALVIEDGSGKADAESYISVDDAVAYHTARGNTAFIGITNVLDKERALRNATDYMLQAYRSSWKGQRVTSTQRLDWPRWDVCVDGYPVDSDVVPEEIRNACAELALRSLTGQLRPDETAQVTEVKVGPITKKYAEGARQGRKFSAVDYLLGPFLKGGGTGSTIPVVRA